MSWEKIYFLIIYVNSTLNIFLGQWWIDQWFIVLEDSGPLPAFRSRAGARGNLSNKNLTKNILY